jgi:hypothetical protein
MRPPVRAASRAAMKHERAMLAGMNEGSADLDFVGGPLLGIAVAMVAMLVMAFA